MADTRKFQLGPEHLAFLHEMPGLKVPVPASDGSGQIIAYSEDSVILSRSVLNALLDAVDPARLADPVPVEEPAPEPELPTYTDAPFHVSTTRRP